MCELNVVYNEDCLETMKRMEDNSIDLVLTDPPYGIGDKFKGGENSKMSKFNSIVEKGWDVAPSKEIFDEIFRVSKYQIIWGGNYFNLPPTKSFLIWDKSNLMILVWLWLNMLIVVLIFQLKFIHIQIEEMKKNYILL